MKKHLLIVGIVVILLTVGLSGCNEEKVTIADADKFVGKWEGYAVYQGVEYPDQTLRFYASGHVEILSSTPFMYRVEGNKLYIDYGEEYNEDIFNYSFSNNYNQLTLIITNPFNESYVGYKYVLNKQ